MIDLSINTVLTMYLRFCLKSLVFQPSVMKLKTPPKGREKGQDEDYEAKLVSDAHIVLDDEQQHYSVVAKYCDDFNWCVGGF